MKRLHIIPTVVLPLAGCKLTPIRDLFKGSETIEDADDETVQLQIDFKY